MTKIVVPTLGVKTFLESPYDKMAYVLRQYVSVPLSVTAQYHDYAISLRDVLSRYGTDMEAVRAPIIENLTSVLGRIFPGSNVEVTALTEGSGINSGYTISISMSVFVDGFNHKLSDVIRIVDGKVQTNDV
jgi:hypothetical protein